MTDSPSYKKQGWMIRRRRGRVAVLNLSSLTAYPRHGAPLPWAYSLLVSYCRTKVVGGIEPPEAREYETNLVSNTTKKDTTPVEEVRGVYY